MAKEEKKYNLTLMPLWMTKSGNYMSMKVTDEIFDNIQQCAIGGKVMFKIMPEERRKNENSPHAYLEFIDPSEVAKFESEKKKSGAPAPRANAAPPSAEADDLPF